MDGYLEKIITLLAGNPYTFDEFPEDQYQQFLQNPQVFPKLLKRFPGGTKYLGILKDCNGRSSVPPGIDLTLECLKTVKRLHHRILLKVRTGATAQRIAEIGAKADLLTTNTPRFISGDDPVIFLKGDARETLVVPTSSSHWSDVDRSVFIPLNPRTAILWHEDGCYGAKPASADVVTKYNGLVKENAIRHIIAIDPSDF
jgi:hypothetical protein